MYGKAIVVFNGYKHKSIKDTAHRRRAAGKVEALVTFDEDMPATSSWPTKKISNNSLTCSVTLWRRGTAVHAMHMMMLMKYFTDSSCFCSKYQYCPFGDDTDLLILLSSYTDLESNDMLFRPEPKRNQPQ